MTQILRIETHTYVLYLIIYSRNIYLARKQEPSGQVSFNVANFSNNA